MLAEAEAQGIITDKDDYAPEETVVINGYGFAATTPYDIPVKRPDGTIVTGDGTFTPGWDTVTTDATGAFVYFYKLDGILGLYEVRVYGSPWSGSWDEIPLSITTFTDYPGVATSFLQWVNVPPYEWIGGAINPNKALYGEGSSVPYRFEGKGIPGGIDVYLTIQYDFIVGDKHAYDFLTSYDYSENNVDLQLGSTLNWATITLDNTYLAIPNDLTHNKDDLVNVADRYFTLGGDWESATIVSGPIIASDPDAKTITLKITMKEGSNLQLLVAYGSHLAIGNSANWGTGYGAGSISGASFHNTCEGFIDANGDGVGTGNEGFNAGDIGLQAGSIQLASDMELVKTATSGSVCNGSQVTYTITVTNNGPSDAVGATVTDTFPSGLTDVSWYCDPLTTPNSVTPTSGTGNINALVTLINGHNAVFHVTGTVNPVPGCSITNSATVTLPSGTDGYVDYPLDNNQDDATITVDPCAVMEVLKKEISTGPYQPGDTINYEYEVRNDGPSTISDITATDDKTGTITFIPDDLTPGQSVKAYDSYTIPLDYYGDVKNTVTVNAYDVCGNLIQDTADVTVTMTSDLELNCPDPVTLPGCNPTPPTCDDAKALVTVNTNTCPNPDVTKICSAIGEITSDGCMRTQVFTVLVTNACDATASCDVTYTWKEDLIDPVLANLPMGGDLGCNPTPPVCDTGVTASDNCDGVLEVTCTPGEIVVDGCYRSQTFTYSAVDTCLNDASADVTYTWKEDLIDPVLANLPMGGDHVPERRQCRCDVYLEGRPDAARHHLSARCHCTMG